VQSAQGGRSAKIGIDGDYAVVDGADTLRDRKARLFFSAVLGAIETDSGWRCPRRRGDVGELAIRISKYLGTNGWIVDYDGAAAIEIERDAEQASSASATARLREARRVGVSEAYKAFW